MSEKITSVGRVSCPTCGAVFSLAYTIPPYGRAQMSCLCGNTLEVTPVAAADDER